jgi:4-hydroxythreonine-4-phosphate dehydrogenase|tara:strand:+ start:2300 stop:3274 length:975 start_codon:yes stop_codon:yes gene_type:complete
MNKPIAIIAGEPNSISSEIIFKCWKLKKKYIHKPLFIIGSVQLLNLQMKQLKYKIKIKKINKHFKIRDLNEIELPVYDIDYTQKKPFEKISSKSNKYIFKCFEVALKFVKDKKILGFINCPISKEYLFKNKHQGVTEFLSKKLNKKNNNEVMLIYNKKLSVSPITTHIPLNQVSKKINQYKIVEKVKIINNFYKKFLNKKPNFAILGLNPHNFSISKKSEEKKIINKAIKSLVKLKINAKGPVAPDSSFVIFKKYKFDVIIGMYHDQVLSPFKALYNFFAINITLGLPYIRISPDHGIAEDIVGKKIANPNSLIESIKFFNYIK